MVDVKTSVWLRLPRLWPSACVLCSAPGEHPALDMCVACRADLPVPGTACVRCAEPLVDHAGETRLLCGRCLRSQPRFDAVVCAYRYAYPIDHMVRDLKFHGAVAHGRVLGELLAAHLRHERREPWPACVIPVPLAPARFRQRGFNQAIEIGAVLERRLHVPLRADLVARVRETGVQADLKRNHRRRNVRGAFQLCSTLPARHVAILDDVVTTGSTVNELARVLKRAGAERVEVWAVARAGKAR